jgi:hypothetical protein
MTEVYAFEHCPFRSAAHAVADRSAIVRHAAHALWPAARRAERVELSDEGIAAWTLTGATRLTWADVSDVRCERALLGRRTLHIDGSAGHIQIAPVLPGYDELERRVRAARSTALVPA